MHTTHSNTQYKNESSTVKWAHHSNTWTKIPGCQIHTRLQAGAEAAADKSATWRHCGTAHSADTSAQDSAPTGCSRSQSAFQRADATSREIQHSWWTTVLQTDSLCSLANSYPNAMNNTEMPDFNYRHIHAHTTILLLFVIKFKTVYLIIKIF